MKTWTVQNMTVRPTLGGLDNVVATVSFVVNASVSENGTEYGYSTYDTIRIAEPDSENFIPYESLTEDVVIGWIKATLGDSRVLAIEQRLDAAIEDQIAPAIATPPLPWA